MKKQKIQFLLLTALCAIAFTGCKKREPVDLSSLHTTEAAAEESLSETEPAGTKAASDEPSAPSVPTDSSSLKTEIRTETAGGASIEYPVISNMKDTARQEQVNALLKQNALAIGEVYPDQTLSVKASVESINLKRITVTYKGTREDSGSSQKERIFFSNTVDLETAENLGLSDFADVYTVAGYLASGDYKLSDAAGSESAIRSAINASGNTTDYYYKKLQAADFSGGAGGDQNPSAGWPEFFSYEKQGVVYVSLPVEPALGSYVLIHYSPDNK